MEMKKIIRNCLAICAFITILVACQRIVDNSPEQENEESNQTDSVQYDSNKNEYTVDIDNYVEFISTLTPGEYNIKVIGSMSPDGTKGFKIEDGVYLNLDMSEMNAWNDWWEGRFNGCEYLKSIILSMENNMGYEKTFFECPNLEKVTLIGFSYIERDMFFGCKKLETVIMLNNKDYFSGIYSGAFFGCISLKNIEIPEQTVRIGNSAFSHCKSLKSISIPCNFGTFAFSNCSSLETVVIKDGITTIEECAFENCEKLKNINIPNSVTELKRHAFSGCSSLEEITIPGSISIIGSIYQIAEGHPKYNWSYVFRDCTNLTTVTIQEGVEEIWLCTFSGCTNLKNITIPSSLKLIGNCAFEKCSSLKTIEIPDSVTYIGVEAFSECSSLTNITIPSNVRSLDGGVFLNCSNLTSVIIPDGFKEFLNNYGDGNFEGCTNLTNIKLPDSLTTIDSLTFSGCTSLTSIIFPENVTSIGSGAFSGCTSLTNIRIPDSITELYDETFKNCSSLEKITISGSPIDLGESNFQGCTNLKELIIHTNQNEISIPNSFKNCENLTAITLPNNLDSIIITDYTFLKQLRTVNYKGTENEWKKINIKRAHYNGTFSIESLAEYIENIGAIVNFNYISE